jgi:predicted dinucleotide-binding enzyme
MKKIAVFGTGVVGQVLAEKLDSLDHEVMIGTRNVASSLSRREKDMYGRPPLSEWHAQHPSIRLGTYQEAASFGEIIINATQGAGSIQALEMGRKENLSGKILLDVSNPLDFSRGMPPTLSICNTDSLGEQIQRTFPELKVVKALNTMSSFLMVNPAALPEDHHVFICGNEAGAKAEVKEVLTSFGWKAHAVIDLGDISNARGTEQLLPIWIRLYGTLKTGMFNFRIVTA